LAEHHDNNKNRAGLPMKKLASVIALVLLAGASSTALLQEPRKPNVVIFFADDLGYADLGSYGNPYIRTPNLDRMALEGQRWTDFYVAEPVCSPSRGALMTGQVPVRSGLYGQTIHVMFPNDRYGIPQTAYTMAEGLKDAGYRTGIFGKWHLGDAPEAFPTRHGFDYWFGVPYSNDMNSLGALDMTEVYRLRAAGRGAETTAAFANLYEYFKDPKVEYWNSPLWRSQKNAGGFEDAVIEQPIEQTTLTRRITEEAVRFIEASGDEPFLAYIPHSMPHLPLFASEEFQGSSIAGPYGDVVQELDWSVGQVRAALERLGIADDTLVIFTSDNGPWNEANIPLSGSAGLLNGSKGSTWEGGVREPTIFWWPGKIQPAVISDIGSTMDVYATVLALAGVSSPNAVDGVDLRPTLFNGSPTARDAMPYYQRGYLKAWRQGRYKLHLYHATRDEALPAPALYDLLRDPGEQQDIAAANPQLVAELTAAAERFGQSFTPAAPIFDQRLRDAGL
jgi:arylsulfatase A-like enzyme